MKLLVINGPNMNMLGIREPEIYGNRTYEDLTESIRKKCKDLNIEVEFYQSNHEGDIVDRIQEAYGKVDGIIINPAAYTHTSIAIPDAIRAVGIPTVEVHLSDPDMREEFRKISFIRPVVAKTFKGMGFEGYLMAVEWMKEMLK